MRRIIRRANRSLTIGVAAAVLAGSYLLSGMFGLLRDRLLTARFGLEESLDAYFVAFSVPDLLFLILVSGALTVTLLPVLSERFQKNNKKSAWEISSSMINLLAILTVLASIGLFVFADPLIRLLAPSFDPERHQLAVDIMRILSLNPFFFAISSVFGTIQQAFGRFFFFALAPVIYNLGIIFGVVYLSPIFDIYGAAYGVVIGAVAQAFVQWLGVVGLGFTYKPHIFWRNKGFRQVIRLIIPRSADESMVYLTTIIERAIASSLAIGSVAAYQLAFNLKNYPITLIGTAIATAAFPKLSERALSTRSDLLKKEILEVARAILWFAIPTAIAVVLLRGYIVRLLLGFGDATVANIFGWFAVAIIFQCLLRLVARIFYAQQDTKTPLYGSMMAIVLNTVLALTFVNLFDVVGLAMAHSVTSIFIVTFLTVVISRRMGLFVTREFMRHLGGIIISSAAMGGVTYLLVRFVFPLLAGETGFFTLAPKFGAIVIISFATYIFIGTLLRLPEAVKFSERLKQVVNQRVQVG